MPMRDYSYLVGALLQSGLTPEQEQAKLNACAGEGWELLAVVAKKHEGRDYTFFYFRRANPDGRPAPRFDLTFPAVA